MSTTRLFSITITILAILASSACIPDVHAFDQTITQNTYAVFNTHATAAEPLVIEGLDITSDGHGMVLKNCSHIIIRDCAIHDCCYDPNNVTDDINAPGTALYIEDCEDVVIERITVSRTSVGIRTKRCNNITVRDCEVSDVCVFAGIMLHSCSNSIVTGNNVHDNGFTELFYGGNDSRRIIGIYIVRGHDIEVSHNTSSSNTSDGISVVGQNYYEQDQSYVWKGTVERVSVHDNHIEGNHEQGIWSVRSRDCTFYDNEIHMDCSNVGIGVGIFFEFDVCGAEAYGNTIYACKVACGVSARASHDNSIHDNTLYTFEDTVFFTEETLDKNHDYSDEQEKARLAGIAHSPSSGNVSENNTIHYDKDVNPEKDKEGPDRADTVVIEGVCATEENPYVIESLTITTDGDGLVIKNCEHVIVRDCVITGCAYTDENIEPDREGPGMGLYVENCDAVTIENCTVSYNLMGLDIAGCSNVVIKNCDVSNNVYHCAIMLERCTGCLVENNTVRDNGFPERFYEYGGGKRIIGIYVIQGSDIEICHNVSERNTSDGILVGGQNYMADDPSMVWKTVVENVTVHDNLIADNYEQGIWVARAHNCRFFNNEIHAGCVEGIGIGSGICFEIDVVDSEVYNNVIYACKVPSGVVLAMSHNNMFYENTLYTYEDVDFIEQACDLPNYDPSDDMQKSKLAGLEYMTCFKNTSYANEIIIGDDSQQGASENVASKRSFPKGIMAASVLICLGALLAYAAFGRKKKLQ